MAVCNAIHAANRAPYTRHRRENTQSRLSKGVLRRDTVRFCRRRAPKKKLSCHTNCRFANHLTIQRIHRQTAPNAQCVRCYNSVYGACRHEVCSHHVQIRSPGSWRRWAEVRDQAAPRARKSVPPSLAVTGGILVSFCSLRRLICLSLARVLT